MIRGLIRRSASYPKPRRSIAPGPKFSTTTSARPTMRSKRARPRSAFRSSVTLRLLALSKRKNHASVSGRSESARRPGSPPGGSILTTSAPSHASISVQLGPASYCVRSRTTIPSRALPISLRRRGVRPLRGVRREAYRLSPRLVVSHHVDDGGLARRPRPLERRPDLMGLLDVLAVRAEILGDFVVAREAEGPSGLAPLGVRRPAAVVTDHDQDGNPVADRRVDLHRVDPVRPVAVQDDHLRVRVRDLRADAERQTHAHAAEGARVQPVPRREGRNRLAPVVEDLLTVHDEDRVATEKVADLLAEPQGMDRDLVRAHLLVHLGRLLGVEGPELRHPRGVAAAIDPPARLGGELLEDGAGVADDRHVDPAVVTELARVHIDLDDFEARGESGRGAGLEP